MKNSFDDWGYSKKNLIKNALYFNFEYFIKIVTFIRKFECFKIEEAFEFEGVLTTLEIGLETELDIEHFD